MKIKPCPFCGFDAVVIQTEGREFPFKVQCTNRKCACRTDNYRSYEKAIGGWNTRVEHKAETENG